MMGPDWLQPVLDWLSANPTWAGLIIFFVAMCESLLIVGVLVPGAIVMLSFGALIALGAIELWSTLLWAIGGAIVGDSISFWLGYHFKDRIRDFWPLKTHPIMLVRGEAFFLRHGGKSVVLGRFVGPIRAVIPTVAGIMGMSPRRFTVINVLSAIAWAPTYILPGVAVGASLSLASQVATRFGLLIFGLIIFLLVVAWLIKRIFRAIQPHATQILGRTRRWAMQHPLLGRYVAPLVDPTREELGSLTLFSLLLLVGSWLFAALFMSVYTSAHIVDLDEATYSLFQNLRSPGMDDIMIGFSQLGDANVTIPMMIILTIYLALRQHLRAAAYWLSAMMFAFINTLAIKTSLGMPRPSPLYDGLSMFAFPSGHAMINTVMYGFLAVMLAHTLRAQYRWLPYTLAGVIVASIAFSRIYLGAHWLSDVLGGLCLGMLWVVLWGTAFQRHSIPLPRIARFSSVLVMTLSSAFALHVMLNQDREKQRYSPPVSTHHLSTQDWQANGWQALPGYRIDIKKQAASQALTVQWAGDLSQIQTDLIAAGWQVSPSFSLSSALRWLAPDSELNTVPILPQAHDGFHEALLMKKYLPEQQRLLSLRLWHSHYYVDGKTPIYLGHIGEFALKHTLLLSYLTQIEHAANPLTTLAAPLANWQSTQKTRDHINIVLIRENRDEK